MASKSTHISLAEARVHAAILAIIGWGVLIVFVVAVPGVHSRFGTLKWTDFVHFYTLGDAAMRGDGAVLYDANALHGRQMGLVPASASERYLPVYAPQTALLFAPLARLPYVAAGAAWAGVIVGVYLLSVYLAWLRSRPYLPDFRTVALLAVAAPPLVQLVGHGQTTPVVLVAFAGGWRACESGRPLLAGLALSLLAIKPQFGLVLAVVAVATGQWVMIAGGLLGAAAQAAATSWVLGGDVWRAYGAMLRSLPAQSALLEPDPSKMHSLSALTNLLPDALAQPLWLLCCTAVVLATVGIWWHETSWRIRFGMLVLASALVNPHLTIYDVAVVALPTLWIGGWLAERRLETKRYWQLVYWLVVSVLLPTAALVKLQLSPMLMLAIFLEVRAAAATGRPARRGRRNRVTSAGARRPACPSLAADATTVRR